MKPELTRKITFEEFEDCIKQGVEQAMKECELTIGMTLKEAVEKQIPKKPIIKLHGTTGWNTKEYCPVCKAMVHSNYCCKCGQALEWGYKK